MREPVVEAAGHLDEQARRHRRFEAQHHLLRAQAAGGLQRVDAHLPAEHGGRLQQRAGLTGRAPRQHPPAVLGQRGEADQVHLARRDGQQVAGLAGEQDPRRRARRPAGLQRPAKLGDVRLQGPGGAGGRLPRPQFVDEAVERDDASGFQGEHGQHGALLGCADTDGTAGRVDDLQRAEQAKVHFPS
ncbi:hypothetical protein OG344_19370 [Microbispora sp. NBC_01389]